ncbi:MAG TPA: DUF6325 family protein [Candidatus Nanopelagicales bacterium]|nr:DUF6325 family protein [Candidatus Nanopelagicales bacterium]
MADLVAPVGPVDIAVVAFDEPKFDGSIASAIADLVAGGIVRVLDIILVNKDEAGEVTILEVTDVDGDGIPDLIAIQGDLPGLIAEDDARAAIEGMPNSSAIALIAWENTWLIRARNAIARNGGTLIAFERIPAEDVMAVLESADA